MNYALTPEQKVASRQRERLWTHIMICATHAVDVVIISLFFWAGTVPWTAPLLWLGMTLISAGAGYVLICSPLNTRFENHTINTWQVSLNIGIQLIGLALFPQLAFFFLISLFTIFSWGALAMRWRPFLFSWLLVCATLGLILSWVGDRIGIPHATSTEVALIWLTTMLTLIRATYASLFISQIRTRLLQRSRVLAESVDRIAILASTDEMTGTLNRRSIWALLEEQIQELQNTSNNLSITLVDFDHFKLVNDKFGHMVGDAVLRTFGAIIRESLRGNDRLGRYGGEEFLLVLPGTSGDQAFDIMERLRSRVETFDWQTIRPGLKVTISAGIATYQTGETANDLLKRVDNALYKAKEAGRNCSAIA